MSALRPPRNAQSTLSHVVKLGSWQNRRAHALLQRQCLPPTPPPPWTVSIRTQFSSAQQQQQQQEATQPRLLQPSIWHSIIPRRLREGIARRRKPAEKEEKKQSNPASYFIWIFLFIGSQAVRILGLKNEHSAYMRRADLKLEQLREVVEKLHRGEEVDVEKVLGTGDEAQELEWEEAMQELASEERRWQQSREKAKEEQARQEKEQQDADPVNDHPQTAPPHTVPQAPGFY